MKSDWEFFLEERLAFCFAFQTDRNGNFRFFFHRKNSGAALSCPWTDGDFFTKIFRKVIDARGISSQINDEGKDDKEKGITGIGTDLPLHR